MFSQEGVYLFSYIKGGLDCKGGDYIVVDVSGIGYKIFMPASMIEKLGSKGDVVKVYTHLHVREDLVNLYGFSCPEELKVFDLLISISGIGPKAAIAVLSSISVSQFILSVVTNDIKALTQVPGIGNKTAQRIILELKDKLKKEQIIPKDAAFSEDTKISEAVSALQVLGYSLKDALQAVRQENTGQIELEEIIKRSLKVLGK